MAGDAIVLLASRRRCGPEAGSLSSLAASALAGLTPGSPSLVYPVIYTMPFYMPAAGPYPEQASEGGGGGGNAAPPASPNPTNHSNHPHTIDALKARVMEAAPGEVKSIIAASRLPLR